MNMNTYKPPCYWQISMPDDWQGEYDKKVVNTCFILITAI